MYPTCGIGGAPGVTIGQACRSPTRAAGIDAAKIPAEGYVIRTAPNRVYLVGSSAGGNQVLVSMDVDAATAVFGDADAELGASMNAAGKIQQAWLPSFSATQIVTARMTSGTGNLGNGSTTNLSQGSVTFYLITEVLP